MYLLQAQSLIGKGKAITYDPAVTVKSNGVPIEFKVNQTARNDIASGTKPKFPMAAVRGIYDELDIFDPDEIFRFNPKKQNVFVDSQGYGVKKIKNGKATTIDEEVFVKLDNPDSFRIIKDANGNEVKLFDDIEYYDSNNLPKTKNPSEVKVLDGKGKKIYHGTNVEYKDFDLDKSADGTMWFSDNKDMVKKGYDGASGNKYVMERTIDEKALKLADWDMADQYMLPQLVDMGYDGIKYSDPKAKDTVYQIFNPKKLK